MAQLGSRTSLAATKRLDGKGRASWVLTACEEELVAVHANGEEGEPLMEEQGAICAHGMGTNAAGALRVAPARMLLSVLWTIEQGDLGVLLRLKQESVNAVVKLVAHKSLRL